MGISNNNLFPVIRKRDGRLCRFDMDKIIEAIYKALYATGIDSKERAEHLAELTIKELSSSIPGTLPQVEEIQDAVENVLISDNLLSTAKAYILYRAKRTSIRDGKSELMDVVEDILQAKNSPSIGNSPHDKMMEIAKSSSKVFYLSRIIPSHYSDAHRKGEIYIHSVEYYDKTLDSIALPLAKFMENGFYGGYAFLKPPKHISTIAAHCAIILNSCQNELFGEVSFPDFDSGLSSFIKSHFLSYNSTELFQAIEGFIYNLNTLYSKTSFNSTLSSISIGLDTSEEGRQIALNLLEILEKGLGKGETPIFPEVIFHVKNGINLDKKDPNYDLFEKAVSVACRRMNPSFAFLDSEFNSNKKVTYMAGGTRMESENPIVGRGNIASVTLNLPRAAFFATLRRSDFLISSFYNELDRLLELSAELLVIRAKQLGALKKKDLPFIMGENIYINSSSLSKNDPIYTSIKTGFLTIGICGLPEAVKILTSKENKPGKAHELGLEIAKHARTYIDNLSTKHGLNFVLSGSYESSPCELFFNIDKSEYPDIEKITDNGRYSHSFVFEHELGKEKLIESAEYHKFFNGGHYSLATYKNCPEPSEVMSTILNMAKNNAGFVGVSFDLNECAVCGKMLEGNVKCACNGKINYISRIPHLTLITND